jgi:cytochrome c
MNWFPTFVAIHSLFASFAALEPAAAAESNPAADLAERRGCLHCHDVGKTRIGPAFRSVADRYRSDPAAQDRLVDWLESGGRGHWGADYAMPEQSHLGPGDAQTLVRWVLGQ